ncbi:MAG: PEP-CTERM sorting domain-containing protein [Candidatus Nealsonbacteria bacterium]|nr:PEP-CTERM sorting domain-containing protein [Candidatus Nealsonbacteria bacterium]
MRALLAIALVFGMAVMSQAATITLTVEADEVAKTWEAFAKVDGGSDNDGISSIWFDVTADGDLAITGSTLELPRGFDGAQMWGFTVSRNDGANGMGLRGGLVTTSVGDAVVTDFGVAAGSMTNIIGTMGPDSWSVPALIASGTYDGEAGNIYVDTRNGVVNLLDNNRNHAQSGQVFDEQKVIGGSVSVPVPEPSTFVLLGLAGLGLFAVRRRR